MPTLYNGKSFICCGGCCLATYDWYMIHVIMMLCSIPYTLFAIFIAAEISMVLVYITIVLYVVQYTVGFLGSITDPGIITPGVPREIVKPQPQPDGQKPELNWFRGHVKNPDDQIVAVGPNNDNLYLCRYCETCHVVRPPRASHCQKCGYCVSEFDHHCVVIGCCVGERTWRYFTWFIVIGSFVNLYAFVVSTYYLVAIKKTLPFNTTREQWDIVCAIGMMVFTAVVGTPLAMLSFNYLWMSARNTTVRDFGEVNREPYWDRKLGFPFHYGCGRNVWRKLFAPRTRAEIATSGIFPLQMD
eukprot:PhF_6_TR40930/c0_g1_i1/m.61918/K16675/ZDHHC9_14_18; palmitoyltransferase ZDHHC9/14/18